MNTLIPVLLATLIFGGRIFYLFCKRRKTVELMPVEAGPTANAKEDFTIPVPVRVGTMPMNPALTYYVVRNDCMTPLHINHGDVVGVQLFDDDFTVNDVKPGDVLLIYLDDENFHGHKIRVMDYAEGKAFHTYYFLAQHKEDSSNPHAFSTIRGVVREINHPYQTVA